MPGQLHFYIVARLIFAPVLYAVIGLRQLLIYREFFHGKYPAEYRGHSSWGDVIYIQQFLQTILWAGMAPGISGDPDLVDSGEVGIVYALLM